LKLVDKQAQFNFQMYRTRGLAPGPQRCGIN
jgi:hypothetical protein